MSMGSSNKNLWKGDLSHLRADLNILIGSLDLGHLVIQTFASVFNMTLPPCPLFLLPNSHFPPHTCPEHFIYSSYTMSSLPGLRDTLSPPLVRLADTPEQSVWVPAPLTHHRRPPPQKGDNYSRLKISKRHNNPTQCVLCNWILNLKENIYKEPYWIHHILGHITVYNTHNRKANMAE